MRPLKADVLFRAAREAVRNAACHSRGGDPARESHLTQTVAWREGLHFVIEDDSVGFGPRTAPALGTGMPHGAGQRPSASNG